MKRTTNLSFTEISEAIDEYECEYRNPRLSKWKVSQDYCLFPLPEYVGLRWPEFYPDGNRAGVYIILNEEKNVLYIGKASFSNTIAARLGSYFGYESDRITCKVHHGDAWSSPPHWVKYIPMEKGLEFEAPALEEFLITKFKDRLPDNKIGSR